MNRVEAVVGPEPGKVCVYWCFRDSVCELTNVVFFRHYEALANDSELMPKQFSIAFGIYNGRLLREH